MTTIVRVDLGARGYDVVVGAGILADAGKRIVPVLNEARVIVVSDHNVAPIYLPILRDTLAVAGIKVKAMTVAPGETSKTFSALDQLTGKILATNIERCTTLVALGGGVVGDLTGFSASILLRGIGFINVPTTLLAQVDSSIGGKTGINTTQGKNLVGNFHQPRLVLTDVNALNTLPQRELLAGYAEMVKTSLIADSDFFSWLEDNGEALLAGDRDARIHAIARCCRIKADIVAADECEAGRRGLLNLGHTFAHALEAEAGYSSTLVHGEAVAIGLCMAFDLSHRLGTCSAEDAVRVRAHLERVGLPTRPTGSVDAAQRLLDYIGLDKKVKDGRPTFVLARGIGDAFLTQDAPPAEVAAIITAA